MKKDMMMGVTVALMTVSCSLNDQTDNPWTIDPVLELKEISLSDSQRQLVSNNNDFSFNLFRQLNVSEPGSGQPKSMVVSPLSITYTLGMLDNGASGETRRQINEVLGIDDIGDANAFYMKMMTQAPCLSQATKLLQANMIYINKPNELKPAFVRTAKTYYWAGVESRDFHDGRTMGVINQWASDRTEQMIDRVLSEDEFKPDAVSYLLNATYFKSAWTKKFNKKETMEEPFDGGRKVPMMHLLTTLNYARTDEYQAVQLPYDNGAFSMTVLLPCEGKTVGDVLSGLTSQNWQRLWSAGGSYQKSMVDVKLPRFESKTDISLVNAMKSLGMSNAFSFETAEFADFCQKPICIGIMKQVARISVNEEGTEAAAVTVAGTLESSAPSLVPVTFHATRPFLYIISERSTGAIFFIGQYMG